MDIMSIPGTPPWRLRLRQGSFKGAAFHVDREGRASGRRTVVHEYPKRDTPYAEDMGRHAFRYQITGYVIQSPPGNARGAMSSDVDVNDDALIAALSSPDPGILIDPYNPNIGFLGPTPLFMCERWTGMIERERGGVVTYEMSFVEAGIPANSYAPVATMLSVTNNAAAASAGAAQNLNQTLQQLNALQPIQ